MFQPNLPRRSEGRPATSFNQFARSSTSTMATTMNPPQASYQFGNNNTTATMRPSQTQAAVFHQSEFNPHHHQPQQQQQQQQQHPATSAQSFYDSHRGQAHSQALRYAYVPPHYMTQQMPNIGTTGFPSEDWIDLDDVLLNSNQSMQFQSQAQQQQHPNSSNAASASVVRKSQPVYSAHGSAQSHPYHAQQIMYHPYHHAQALQQHFGGQMIQPASVSTPPHFSRINNMAATVPPLIGRGEDDVATTIDEENGMIYYHYAKRSADDFDQSEDTEAQAAQAPPPKKRIRPLSSIGEHRLKIRFESFGTIGEIKQTYGRRDSVIPDGLVGRNEVYNEPWRFEIRHHRRGARVTIEWIVTNVHSKHTVSRRETLEESIIRESQGKTICNQVLKQALEDRARQLEAELRQAETDGNITRVSSLQSRIKALRPKRCLIGLLFFGLQHQTVQHHMGMPTLQSSSSVESAAVAAAQAPTDNEQNPEHAAPEKQTESNHELNQQEQTCPETHPPASWGL